MCAMPDCCPACRRDVLRDSARKEFEAARFETDPEIVGLLGFQELEQGSCAATCSARAYCCACIFRFGGCNAFSGGVPWLFSLPARPTRMRLSVSDLELPPPLQINRLLVVGRDAVHRVAEKVGGWWHAPVVCGWRHSALACAQHAIWDHVLFRVKNGSCPALQLSMQAPGAAFPNLCHAFCRPGRSS